MAVFAFTNAKVVINSVDLSDHISNVSFEMDSAALDATAMNAGGWQTFVGGLKNGKVDVTFNADYASSSVDATLWTAFSGGAPVAMTVKAVNAATSATNPEYQFNVLVNQFPAVGGKVGDLGTLSVSWPSSGAVTRATS